MIIVVDCNNFWSASGGGVRRYHLQKMEAFKKEPAIRYIFVMNDDYTETEHLGGNVIVEHIRVPKVKGNRDYRFLFTPEPLINIFMKHHPDIIECGSPYIMPWLIRLAIRKLPTRPVLTAFWHADFPVTYVERILAKRFPRLGRIFGALAWWYAKFTHRVFDGCNSHIDVRLCPDGH